MTGDCHAGICGSPGVRFPRATRPGGAIPSAEMAGLNVLTYLTAYLDACGRNAGKPPTGPDLERFLPWNAAPADLHAWAHPPPAA